MAWSWGIKEHIAETSVQVPKYRSLLGFAHGNKYWWQNCASGNVVRNVKPERIPQHLISGKQDLFESRYIAIPKQLIGQKTLHQSSAVFIGKVI